MPEFKTDDEAMMYYVNLSGRLASALRRIASGSDFNQYKLIVVTSGGEQVQVTTFAVHDMQEFAKQVLGAEGLD